jgi:hypothetical protein
VPFCPLDPGWIKSKDPDRDEQPGSYFLKLRNHFWVKMLKFFDADPGWKNSDPGWKKPDPG